MLSVLQNKSVEFLETIVHTLDSYEEIQKRQRVFAKNLEEEQEADKDKVKGADQDARDVNPDEPKEKLKHLGFELIDITIHTSKKGLDLL